MTESEMKIELQRAYRCIQGLHNAVETGKTQHLTYHQMTIAAAKRFVFEDAMYGSNYFINKPVEVLHKAMQLPGAYLTGT